MLFNRKPKIKTATLSCEISGMDHCTSVLREVTKYGDYSGKATLEPDDTFPDSVTIYVDDHVVGYVPRRSRKGVRLILNDIIKSEVEIKKSKDSDGTYFTGTLNMVIPADAVDKLRE